MIEAIIFRILPKNVPNERHMPTERGKTRPNIAAIFCFSLAILVGKSAIAMDLSKMKIDGFIAILGEVENTDKYGLDDVEAELRLKTPRYKDTRAVITVDGKYYRRSLYLEDLYIDHKFHKNLKLTAGISKKILGLEYENGRQYRATIHRSPIYKKMESLGIVGRQFNLRLSGKATTQNGLNWSAAIGTDGTRDVNLLASLQKPLANAGVGTWLLIEAHKVGSYYDALYSQVFSFWYDIDILRMSMELFVGNDTRQTEYNEIFEDGRTVFFSGGKFEALGDYRFSKKVTFNPVFQTSFWMNDMENRLNNSLHFLLGARWRIGRIAVSLNGRITGERLENTGQRIFNDRAVYGEIFFDF